MLDSMNCFQLCIMFLFVVLERLLWSGLSDVGKRIMILFSTQFLISIDSVKYIDSVNYFIIFIH